ncbi:MULTISPECIES: CPBP family intramembrane glutamic endopeptidase [unclassified Geodermatophilus]
MSTTTEVAPSRGRLHRLTRRRPLTVFLVLAIGLSYALVTLWGLAYHGHLPGGDLHEVLGIAPDELTGVVIALALLPAAVYVTGVTEGSAGVRALFRRAFRWRVHPGWWLTVLLALPVLTIALGAAMGDELRPVDVVPVLVSQAGLLLVNLVLVNLWEETAWTGVLQTRLERRHNWYVAALLVAVPFAVVHVPLEFFLDQQVTPGVLLGALVSYFLLGVFVRPLLAAVRRGTGGSLLLVALLHSVFNRTNNDNGIAAEFLDGQMRAISMLVATVLLTVAVAVVARRRLSRQYGRELEASPR